VRQCKPAQDRAASRRKPDPDFALVFGARSSRDCARDLKTVHQFDGAVMLDEESCGNFPNRGLYALGKALDGKQQLSRCKVGTLGGVWPWISMGASKSPAANMPAM
jgi:hypothetical protein